MRNWMKRGLVFAVAMIVLRLIQSALINAFQTEAGLISLVLLAIFIVVAAAWGVLDGRADASANPDPDRRDDLAMTWLLGGLLAGVLSGAVSWLISLFYSGLYTGGVVNEVTTFAAFTALIIFLPGIIGVALGRWLVDRNAPPAPTHDGSHQRADTDVFAAVRDDEGPTREAAATHEQTRAAATAVATAERDERTEVISTSKHEARTESIAESDAPTETIKLPTSEGKTDVIRTYDADQTKPGTPKKD
jgi:predicted lipid-binding transport protein (Tim44 family)